VPEPSRSGAKLATGLLAAIALVAVTAWAWRYGGNYPGTDFFMHWAVVDVLPHDGVPSLYSDTGLAYIVQNVTTAIYDSGSTRLEQAQRPSFATPATPFLHTALLALHTGDYDRDYAIFRATTLVATLVGVVGLGVFAGLPFVVAALLYVATTILFDPFTSALRAANVSQLQLGVLAVYLMVASSVPTRRAGRVLAGVILGALLCFKPNIWGVLPCVLFVYVVRGEVRSVVATLAGLAIGAAVAIATSSRVYGSMSAWPEWAAYVTQFAERPPLLASGNFALPGLLALESVPRLSLLVGAAMLAVFAIAATGQRETLRDMRERDSLLWSLGIGVAITLLSGTLAWVHYFNLIVPLAVFLLAFGIAKRSSVHLLAGVVGLLLIAGRPLAWITASAPTPDQAAATALSGVVLMFLAACYLPTPTNA
jgi:hypothetical protein